MTTDYTPMEVRSQREYVRCMEAGIGFASHADPDRPECRLWLYNLRDGSYAMDRVSAHDREQLLEVNGQDLGIEWIEALKRKGLR